MYIFWRKIRKFLRRNLARISLSATALLCLLGGVYAFHQQQENSKLTMQLTTLSNQLQIITQSLQQSKILNQNSAQQIAELSNRQTVAAQSQNQSLTAAVAEVAPAVVSIVISEDVPNLKVEYENPFGDDPDFQGTGLQIPVYVQDGTTTQEVGAGTGLIINSNGYILTNKHVASDLNAEYTVLLSSGAQKQAKVLYQDPNNDIAILKIVGSGYPTAVLGDSATLQLGETVAAIGNALGEYNNSVSVGVISGLNRTINASDENGNTEQLTGVVQTDAAINPGNSGGPLLGLNGQVLAINVATVVGSNNIGFSIPINEVKGVIANVVP